MLRAILLSVLMVTAVGATLPIGETYARWQGASVNARYRSNKHYNRNRRAWLRKRRAQLRRQRALAAWRARQQSEAKTPVTANLALATAPKVSMPHGWTMSAQANGATLYQLREASGAESAITLSTVVQPSSQAARSFESRRRALAGVAHAELRRRVIDDMIKQGGYITNDTERTINGQKSFVVSATVPRHNTARTVNYYFVEVGGGIYSLAADTTPDKVNHVISQIETLVANLKTKPSNTVAKSFE